MTQTEMWWIILYRKKNTVVKLCLELVINAYQWRLVRGGQLGQAESVTELVNLRYSFLF